MPTFNDRTGEQFKNRDELGGYEFVIIKYNRYGDLWVEFQDKYKARVHTNMNACKKGEVKNPYHPSVFKIGRLGLMKDGSKPKTTDNGKNTREYELWKNMIQRCYSDKYHEKYPTYKDCVVCDRWLVFSNFIQDLPLIEGYELWKNNPKEYIALDKDSKAKGNKVYSLETCCFMTNSDNVKECIERNGNPTPRKKLIATSLTETKVLVFQSISQAKKLGFDQGCIYKCCQGKHKQHKGYKWKCID